MGTGRRERSPGGQVRWITRRSAVQEPVIDFAVKNKTTIAKAKIK